MSAWKLIAQELHQAGRPLRWEEMAGYSRQDMQRARYMGVAECVGGTGRYRWQLTQLGRDWCEGRAVPEYRRPGGYFWTATWLRALPQGLRLSA
jgi:hypothetical protein